METKNSKATDSLWYLVVEKNGVTHIHTLHARLTTIGSSSKNALILNDTKVAAKHAYVTFSRGQHQLRNLQGKESVYLNGSSVTGVVDLQSGDIIGVGDYTITYTSQTPQNSPRLSAQDGLSELSKEQLLELFSDLLDSLSMLLRSKDHTDTISNLVGVVARLMSCDGVRLFSKTENDLHQVITFPKAAFTSPYCQSALDSALQKMTTVLIHDIETIGFSSVQESMELKNIRSVLCAPLGLVDGEVTGFLYLDRLKGHEPFSSGERNVFERLRGVFSSLIDNVESRQRQFEAITQLQEGHCDGTQNHLIYESSVMKEVVAQAHKVAASHTSVLIYGETGTGKEVLARYIHAQSNRSSCPFITVNCGAIPENLMESEFFGHVKGAFTGATTARKGHIVSADTGVLFLDEIGELPINLQVKLLRVLQQQEVVPVGATKPIAVDVRILSATNKNLSELIVAGAFREDLYYRLNVITLTVPPLRERIEDITLLAHYFIKIYSSRQGIKAKPLSKRALNDIVTYSWPGNIRELENRIQRALALSTGSTISSQDLGLSDADSNEPSTRKLEEKKETLEHEEIIKALQQVRGNISRAGEILGMHRNVLTRKISRYQIDINDFK